MEETVYVVEEDDDEEEIVKMSCDYNSNLVRLTNSLQTIKKQSEMLFVRGKSLIPLVV